MPQSRKRKYRVPRGTASKLSRETHLAERHIGLCIKGQRTPGVELAEALEREEIGACTCHSLATRNLCPQHGTGEES